MKSLVAALLCSLAGLLAIHVVTTAGKLLPESALKHECYGWPDKQFTPSNHAPDLIDIDIASGDDAVDFTVRFPHFAFLCV